MNKLTELHAALNDAEMTSQILTSKLDNLATINNDSEATRRNDDIMELIEKSTNTIDIIKRKILILEHGFLNAMRA